MNVDQNSSLTIQKSIAQPKYSTSDQLKMTLILKMLILNEKLFLPAPKIYPPILVYNSKSG